MQKKTMRHRSINQLVCYIMRLFGWVVDSGTAEDDFAMQRAISLVYWLYIQMASDDFLILLARD